LRSSNGSTSTTHFSMLTPRQRFSSDDPAARGKLGSRPPESSRMAIAGHGPREIEVEGRTGLLLVPNTFRAGSPAPLIIMLHGAGGTPKPTLDFVSDQAQARSVLVFAPKSRAQTWDVIAGGFGPDVRFIDRALGRIFADYAVDRLRIGVGGFSDGASYALSLGLLNGTLFSDILAFSPGFAVSPDPVGKPRIFISHGVQDNVLPIDRCGRRLARELARAHYAVLYREFAGGHTVPPELVDEAVERFLKTP
jgi:phospholipase/carboxylesterase